MCLSEGIGGWRICGEALFIEKIPICQYEKCFVSIQNLSVEKARFRTELLLQSKK